MLRYLLALLLLPALAQAQAGFDMSDSFYEVYYDNLRVQAGHTLQSMPNGCTPKLEDKACMARVDEMTAYFLSRVLELKGDPSLKTLKECSSHAERQTPACAPLRKYIDGLTADYLKAKKDKSAHLNTLYPLLTDKFLPSFAKQSKALLGEGTECDADCESSVDYWGGYYIGFMYAKTASYTPKQVGDLSKCIYANDATGKCEAPIQQAKALSERCSMLINLAVKVRSKMAKQ